MYIITNFPFLFACVTTLSPFSFFLQISELCTDNTLLLLYLSLVMKPLSFLQRTEEKNTVSLKWHPTFFFFEFAYLLAFFSPFFADCHPPCLFAHTGIFKHCQGWMCERGREWKTVSKGERSRSRDALWVTPLNEAQRAVHGSPSAEHTSKPVLHLYCQHLGEERSEGGAAFEHTFSCLCSL